MANLIVNTVIRSIAVYALALFLARLMGRKLISQMTFFDFVVGVSMGSIIANAMIGPGSSISSSVAALIMISLLTIGIAYMHIKSFRGRKLVNSEPLTLVDNGNIVEENMRRTRLTINELMMKLREKNTFNLADVEFAIMETDGELSVLPKSDKRPLTPSHMNIQTISTGLTRDIIIDGNLIDENLTGTELDRNWILSQLRSQNINDISDVFYAGLDGSKNLYISKKHKDRKEKQGKYGIE